MTANGRSQPAGPRRVLILGAAAVYLIALPAFFYLLKPIPGAQPA